MKRVFLIKVIFLMSLLNLFSYEFFEQFELKRLTANFYGVCINQNTLLAYGDGGIILRTTNWGKDWQQINLNDSLCIIDMLYTEGKFYGISKFQYLLYSSDDGEKWEMKDFGKETRLYKLFLTDTNIILVTRGKILFLGKENLKLVKTIEIPRKGSFYPDEYLEIVQIANDNLIFQYSTNELCLLSLKNGSYKIVTLPNSINPLIKKIMVTSKDVFLFFDDRSLFNFNTQNNELTYLGTLPPAFSRTFSSFNNDLFTLCNFYNQQYNIDSLFFGKYEKDTFFQKLDQDFDRHISQLYFTDLKFKNQDTIVAVGRDKLIIISFDGGKTWKVQSLFNFSRKNYFTIPSFYIFKGKYLRVLGTHLCFFSSNDTGTTWLPPNKIKLNFKENSDLVYPYWELGTYLNEDTGFIFTNVESFNIPNFLFTTDGGNSFYFDTNSIGHFNSIVFPQFVKYKNEYFLITSGKLQIKGRWSIKNFFRKIDFKGNKIKYENVNVDTTMQFIFVCNINDTLYAVIQKELGDKPSDTLFAYVSYDGFLTWDSLAPMVIKTRTTNQPDFGKVYRFDDNLYVNIGFRKDKYDTINNYLDCLYHLNFKEKIFREIIQFDSNLLFYHFLPFRFGKYFLLEYYYVQKQNLLTKLLFTSNIEFPLNKWKELSINPRFSQKDKLPTILDNGFVGITLSLPITNIEPNSFLILTYDNYHHTDVLFLAKLKENSIFFQDSIDVLPDSLNVSKFDLYVSNPYPIPASNSVKFKIYFSTSYSIEDIDINGWDILGKKIADKNKFLITPFNSYSAEVLFDVSNFSPGIYIISVSLGNLNKKVLLSVVK